MTAVPRSGLRSNGRTAITEGTPFQLLASVQPASPQDLITSEDLLKKESGIVYKIITEATLKATTKTSVCDLVKYNGKDFDVFSVAPWDNGILKHNVYLIQEVVL